MIKDVLRITLFANYLEIVFVDDFFGEGLEETSTKSGFAYILYNTILNYNIYYNTKL